MAKKIKLVTYGIGGFDETKPNNNIVETLYYSDEELAKLEAEANATAARQAILDRLGLTAEEAALLLGAN